MESGLEPERAGARAGVTGECPTSLGEERNSPSGVVGKTRKAKLDAGLGLIG